MSNENFIEEKDELITLVRLGLLKSDLSIYEKKSLSHLFEVLNQYTFENRFEMKGVLKHTIIDSLQIDYSLAEKCIKFDDKIGS